MKKLGRFSCLLLALLMLLLLPACGVGNIGSSDDIVGGGSYSETPGDSNAGVVDKDPSPLPENRKLIKIVNETVETLAYDDFLSSLKDEVFAAGGYFSSSSYRDASYGYSTLRSAQLTLRIPAENLDDFCAKVDGLGHVTYFEERVDDITLSYVSLESRIAVLQSEESALLDMLAKAEKIEDMLAIRAQLEDVQAELSTLLAQKRVYDDSVAYSTINMTVREVQVKSVNPKDDSFLTQLGDTFMASLHGVANFFTGLALFFLGNSPVLLLIAAIGVGIFFLIRFLIKLIIRKCTPNKPE